MAMIIGEKKLTTNPSNALSEEKGQFLVVDFYGKVERYTCSGSGIVSVLPEPPDGKTEVPWGMFSIEKLSNG